MKICLVPARRFTLWQAGRLNICRKRNDSIKSPSGAKYEINTTIKVICKIFENVFPVTNNKLLFVK